MVDHDAAHPAPDDDPASHRRRQFRLSLRALMLLVVLFGCGLGWVVHRATVQRDAVAAIRAAGGSVGYDRDLVRVTYIQGYGEHFAPSQSPIVGWRRWADAWLGPDYFDTVKTVTLGPRTTDATMAQVGRLDQLEDIDAPGDDELTDDGLIHLRGLPMLRGFGLFRSRGVTGAGLVHLAGSLGLQRLALGYSPVTDAHLTHIRGLANLRMLRFYAADGVTDQGLRRLSGLAQLRELIIKRSNATGHGLLALSRMQEMDQLMILGSQVDHLEALRPMTKLKSLFITGSPLKDAGLAPVAGMVEMLYLKLDDTQVSDAGLQALVGLGKLREVSVRNCPVTDDGAARFRRARPLVGLFR